MDFNSKRRVYGALALVLLCLGFAAGWFAAGAVRRAPAPFSEQRLGGYMFINPLLECDSVRTALDDNELRPFRHRIERLIADRGRVSPSVSHVSVYFRDMNNGLGFDIHGNEKFTPASLVKVPLMMAWLKAAEADPSLLGRAVLFAGGPDQNAGQVFPPAAVLQAGRTYTIDELIRAMIVHSDNNAYFLLFANIDPKILRRVYTDLGLEVPKVRTRDDYMTVVEYASFFRILFNASYLRRDLSEKALQYLAEVDFAHGLVAGVPPGIRIAQKFGERTLGDHGEIKQLHDCGIVYYPGHPYLLCVMTRGTSFEFLDVAIREISVTTFGEIDRQHQGR